MSEPIKPQMRLKKETEEGKYVIRLEPSDSWSPRKRAFNNSMIVFAPIIAAMFIGFGGILAALPFVLGLVRNSRRPRASITYSKYGFGQDETYIEEAINAHRVTYNLVSSNALPDVYVDRYNDLTHGMGTLYEAVFAAAELPYHDGTRTDLLDTSRYSSRSLSIKFKDLQGDVKAYVSANDVTLLSLNERLKELQNITDQDRAYKDADALYRNAREGYALDTKRHNKYEGKNHVHEIY